MLRMVFLAMPETLSAAEDIRQAKMVVSVAPLCTSSLWKILSTIHIFNFCCRPVRSFFRSPIRIDTVAGDLLIDRIVTRLLSF